MGKRRRADKEGHSFTESDIPPYSVNIVNTDLHRRIANHCNNYRSLLKARDHLATLIKKLKQHQANSTVPKSMRVSMHLSLGKEHETTINSHTALTKKFEQESLTLLIAARETELSNTQATITAFVNKQTASLTAHYEALRREPQNANSTSFNETTIAAFTTSLKVALDNVNSSHEAQRIKEKQMEENVRMADEKQEEQQGSKVEKNVNELIAA